ncbi:IS110 family transposase [Ferrimonas sp. YFM]|uniref:IS110 family transposase n=1 Tax=Ferrimonas sp. YFM TaxID=3028878 RepID=UPI0025735190|nr:IS110 family transposase [Ferrimonas sp. YFM]BDY02996.1 putative family 20 transposase [Ferrimonas sp. YFM]BDY05512.1 putative family 20 transposase [Ferrimonas sp. YFM]BDY07091.1 putative family 20 transposase [Ferrimonas sp. YFM]
MLNLNIIGIDLAKSSFQVATLSPEHQVLNNRSMSRARLEQWLAKQKPSIVAVEACGSAHYWGRFAESFGHSVMIIAPKTVTPYRQGHKTDSNDALAIAIAARQPSTRSAAVKSVEQQALQSIERMRQHWLDHNRSTSNMMRSLLYEFGITIAKGNTALIRIMPELLDGSSELLPQAFKAQLSKVYQQWQRGRDELKQIENQLSELIKQQSPCKRLMKLEGVGEVNALALYLILGERGEGFKNGREAAACIGVTPKQFSTGGVTSLGGIGKRIGHKRLRANLIQGALAVAMQLGRRPPKTLKEKWLLAIIERRGLRRAAVALVNKTIRTAWAMLHRDQDYQQPQAI